MTSVGQFHAKAGIATVRPLRAEDETSLARSACSRAIWKNLRNTFPYPYTLKDAREWISLTSSEDPAVNFAIAYPADTVIGGIGLTPGSDIHRLSAELGFWLSEEYWNRGIVTAAVKAVTEYALNDLGFMRVFAQTFSRNWGSRSVLEKNRFILEGIQRKHAVKEEKIFDMAIYSVISHGNGKEIKSKAPDSRPIA